MKEADFRRYKGAIRIRRKGMRLSVYKGEDGFIPDLTRVETVLVNGEKIIDCVRLQTGRRGWVDRLARDESGNILVVPGRDDIPLVRTENVRVEVILSAPA